jgi:hypothetical protein
MITNQIMKRQFYDNAISQRTKDGFFNATEFIQAFNSISGKNLRFKEFWDNKGTQQFLDALQREISNGDNSPLLKTHESTRGSGGSTWMHPYLFVKFAMWLSPELEVKIIKWVYDNLIDFRNQAGDYYKEMCAAISSVYESYNGKKADPLIYVKEAHFLNQLVFGNSHGNQRNIATSEQLELMNKLQLANIKLINEFTSKQKRYESLVLFAKLYSK